VTLRRFGILLGRICVAAMAACFAAMAGTVAASIMPKLLLRLPIPTWPPAPPTPLVALAIFGSMLLGVPVFAYAISRGGWTRFAYLGYALAVPSIAVAGILAGSPPARALIGTHGYDVLWILLTELVPGGVAAGLAAHAMAETGEAFRARLQDRFASHAPG
jgi:hypothetical protein